VSVLPESLIKTISYFLFFLVEGAIVTKFIM